MVESNLAMIVGNLAMVGGNLTCDIKLFPIKQLKVLNSFCNVIFDQLQHSL